MLIQTATAALRQFSFDLGRRKLDRAYVEYLRASTIATRVIPRHKDCALLRVGSCRVNVAYRNLREVQSQFLETFALPFAPADHTLGPQSQACGVLLR